MQFPPLKKIYLTIYRTAGLAALTGTLGTLIFYGFLMIFFLFNASWIAPTILSPTSDRMLQFQTGYASALQNWSTLSVAQHQAERDVAAAKTTLDALYDFQAKFGTYRKDSDQLADARKQNIAHSTELSNQLNFVKQEAQKNLAAGIITNIDATQLYTTIQQFNSNVTDSKVAVEVISQTDRKAQLDLQTAILLATNDLKTKQDTLEAASMNIKVANSTLDTLRATSYMRAMTDRGSNLAFIPYDNISNVKVGQPVYDCYLMVIACHQVGTIKKVYGDEQMVDFPIFNVRFSRTVRGVFLEMDMSDPDSMKSSIVFFGRKPLFL